MSEWELTFRVSTPFFLAWMPRERKEEYFISLIKGSWISSWQKHISRDLRDILGRITWNFIASMSIEEIRSKQEGVALASCLMPAIKFSHKKYEGLRVRRNATATTCSLHLSAMALNSFGCTREVPHIPDSYIRLQTWFYPLRRSTIQVRALRGTNALCCITQVDQVLSFFQLNIWIRQIQTPLKASVRNYLRGGWGETSKRPPTKLGEREATFSAA